MRMSHVDEVNLKTWTLSVICCLATFVNFIVFVVAAHFPDLGFPCSYYEIVDFNNLNLSTFNAIHHLTPQLYLDGGQLIAYVAYTGIAFFCIATYYITCWAKIFFRKDVGVNLNQSTRDITYMGDASSCFLFVLTMDTFQVFVLTMSFRLPAMIAFSKCLYFICLTVFTVMMITHYQSYERSSFALAKIHPQLHGTVKFKTLIVNLAELTLGFSAMVLAMSLCLGFGNNFFVKTAHMVFGTLIVFAVLMTIYFIIIETVFHRYVKVQFGFHLGSFFGLCAAVYPVVKYETLNASEYARDINLTLGLLYLIWFIFAVIRVVRFFWRRRQSRYRPLTVTKDEVKSLQSDIVT